jgi:hypothetical protein
VWPNQSMLQDRAHAAAPVSPPSVLTITFFSGHLCDTEVIHAN